MAMSMRANRQTMVYYTLQLAGLIARVIYSCFQADWDDAEEQNYRLWIRQMQDARAQQYDVDWSELDGETAFRHQWRQRTEANADVAVHWDDAQERHLREKYIEMR